MALRGRILVRLGRVEEARACLDATININDLIDPTVLFIGHLGYVDLAWCIDDAAMALRHAANIGDLADRHGSSYLRAYRRAASATAHGIAGDYDLAVRATLDGLDRLAQTRAAVELEPELLASLAEYRMRSGDLTEARKAAEGAIALAHQRDARLPACRARITLATLTAKSGRANASALLSQEERADRGNRRDHLPAPLARGTRRSWQPCQAGGRARAISVNSGIPYPSMTSTFALNWRAQYAAQGSGAVV